jgi:tetratricopeptide (TPR) repeat protein
MIRSSKEIAPIFFVIMIAMLVLGAENDISNHLIQIEGNITNEAHDWVTIVLSVQTENASRSIAARENDILLNQTVSALGALGINEKNIQKSNASFRSEQREDLPKSRSDNRIIIKINLSEHVGSVIDEALHTGINEILVISSDFKQPYLKARQHMMRSEDANSVAKVIASDEAIKLGYIANISIRNNQGSFNAVLEAHDKVNESENVTEYAWCSRGNRYYTERRYEDAIKAYNRANEINPNSDTWYSIGNALLFLRKYDEAIKAYDNALKLNSSFMDAQNNKGEAFRLKGYYIDAISAYNKAIDLDPSNGESWSNKGLALFYLGMYDKAIESFDESIKLNPQFGLVWNHKDKAIAIDPRSANALIGKGFALCALAKCDEAIKVYDKAIYIDPDSAIAWNSKGLALSILNRDSEALYPFDRAIEIDPDYADAWYNKGIALFSLGDFNEANKCFDKAVELDPEYGITWISSEGATIRLIGSDAWYTSY